MEAQNLTICVPYAGCDKNCRYCVSKMTGYQKSNGELMVRNLIKVKRRAKLAHVDSVLITGKGETFREIDKLFQIAKWFRNWPSLEVQTNGIILNANRNELVPKLAEAGLDIVALSIDQISQFSQFEELIASIIKHGMNVRASLNVTDMLPHDITLKEILNICSAHKIRQLLLRKIVAPDSVDESNSVARWIAENTKMGIYERFMEEHGELIDNSRLLRKLSQYNMVAYDLNMSGVSVVSSDYCIQNSHEDNNLRSLIFMEDGHLYTAWDNPASMLF